MDAIKLLLVSFIFTNSLFASNKAALIIDGGIDEANHKERYYHFTRDAYDFYQSKGINRENISVLAKDGNWSRNASLESLGSEVYNPNFPPINNSAKKQNIKIELVKLLKQIGPSGELEIFTNDHGFNDGNVGNLQNISEQTGINLWGERLSNQEFIDMLKSAIKESFPEGAKNLKLKMIANQCFSGAGHAITEALGEVPGVNACSVSSTSSWAPSNVRQSSQTGASVDTFSHSFFDERRTKDSTMFDAFFPSVGGDIQNNASGMLSSMSLMSKIFEEGDNSPLKRGNLTFQELDLIDELIGNYNSALIRQGMSSVMGIVVENPIDEGLTKQLISQLKEAKGDKGLECPEATNDSIRGLETFIKDNLLATSDLLFSFDSLPLKKNKKDKLSRMCKKSMSMLSSSLDLLLAETEKMKSFTNRINQEFSAEFLSSEFNERKRVKWLQFFWQFNQYSLNSIIRDPELLQSYSQLKYCLRLAKLDEVGSDLDKVKVAKKIGCEMSDDFSLGNDENYESNFSLTLLSSLNQKPTNEEGEEREQEVSESKPFLSSNEINDGELQSKAGTAVRLSDLERERDLIFPQKVRRTMPEGNVRFDESITSEVGQSEIFTEGLNPCIAVLMKGKDQNGKTITCLSHIPWIPSSMKGQKDHHDQIVSRHHDTCLNDLKAKGLVESSLKVMFHAKEVSSEDSSSQTSAQLNAASVQSYYQRIYGVDNVLSVYNNQSEYRKFVYNIFDEKYEIWSDPQEKDTKPTLIISGSF